MEQAIIDYIRSAYSPEAARLLLNALGVLADYSYEEINNELLDMIGSHQSRHPEDTMDGVRAHIVMSLHAVTAASGFRLSEETPIDILTRYLTTLSVVSRLEDHDPVLQVMETFMSDIEKFGFIMQTYGPMTELEYHSSIVEVSPVLLDAINRHALSQQQLADVEESLPPKYGKALKALVHKFGRNSLGAQMVTAGVAVGEKLAYYQACAGDHIHGATIDQTAQNILSLLLISEEGCDEPYRTFTAHPEGFGVTLEETTAVAHRILKWSAELARIEV